MSFPLHVRSMLPTEVPMVLSDWKKDLVESAHKGLHEWEWWALVNHVLDRVTLPSASVHMGCHESEPGVSCCWVALRDGEILHMYARRSVREDLPLAAAIERELRSRLGFPKESKFDLFSELKR